MFYGAFILFLLYGLACGWLVWQWQRLQSGSSPTPPNPNFLVSVVVPVRNEAANIEALLQDFAEQTLPKKHFEIIVANDASTDHTALIVKQFQNKNNLNLTLVSLPDAPVAAPKKRAIAEALKVANGTLIATTDGDCRVSPRWLEAMAHAYAQTNAKFISGPVTFHDEPTSWFNIFQTIEFASLIGTGGCLVAAGAPSLCNGANLAFERAAFDAVGGYAGTTHVASGDDELLMHKIAQQYPEGVVFLKNEAAIVRTQPAASWRLFYAQRVRWGSKWAVNRRVATMVVAVFVFLVNLAFLLLPLLLSWPQTALLWFLKLLPEFWFLRAALRFLGKTHLVPWIVPVQFFYPFYVLFFGIAAQQKGYVWKGRRLQ
jgi:cellulose synthase/poly-beta-1,6-N-acetylglucosamine synthase-like glycosyltransferase